MGLDTSHDCWHGSYNGFGIFRNLVGKVAGLPYRKPNMALGEFGHDVLDIDWDQITMRQIMGHWDRKGPTVDRGPGYDAPITDPVLYLLVHSDCDGKLRRGYLPELKTRLEELTPKCDELADEHVDFH
jgi:hypothetical protein